MGGPKEGGAPLGSIPARPCIPSWPATRYLLRPFHLSSSWTIHACVAISSWYLVLQVHMWMHPVLFTPEGHLHACFSLFLHAPIVCSKRLKGAHAAHAAGVPAPAGRKALGWRVGVYLPESAAFAEGEVLGCCNLSGRHHLMYDSGEQEHVLLSCVKVRAFLFVLVLAHDATSAFPLSEGGHTEPCHAPGRCRASRGTSMFVRRPAAFAQVSENPAGGVILHTSGYLPPQIHSFARAASNLIT